MFTKDQDIGRYTFMNQLIPFIVTQYWELSTFNSLVSDRNQSIEAAVHLEDETARPWLSQGTSKTLSRAPNGCRSQPPT